MDFLNVNTIAFNILGYPMSYLELFGTIFYLLSVWLIARRNILTWPIGIASVILYLLLFYQIRLYADTAEQVYYLIISIYGWWHWQKSKQETDSKAVPAVRYSTRRSIIIAIVVTLILSVLVGDFLSQANTLLPDIFPEPAVYPYLDALTTIMSFTAMWLMTRKKIESWIYWIIVDVIAIWLYYVNEVRFISLLYVILLIMAINGFMAWHKTTRQPKVALQT